MMNEKIIESLKCCSRRNCNDCPMRKDLYSSCVNDLSRDALRLINDQQAEIESIKNERAMMFKFSEEQMNEIKEEVLSCVELDVNKIKREAYEQFVNKIKTTNTKTLVTIITGLIE